MDTVEKFRAEARQIILMLARTPQVFSANEVRDGMVTDMPNGAVLGRVFYEVQSEGLIEPAGEVRSANPASRGAKIRAWRGTHVPDVPTPEPDVIPDVPVVDRATGEHVTIEHTGFPVLDNPAVVYTTGPDPDEPPLVFEDVDPPEFGGDPEPDGDEFFDIDPAPVKITKPIPTVLTDRREAKLVEKVEKLTKALDTARVALNEKADIIDNLRSEVRAQKQHNDMLVKRLDQGRNIVASWLARPRVSNGFIPAPQVVSFVAALTQALGVQPPRRVPVK